MNQVIITNKLSGETPLECIYRFKKTHPEYESVKMTYAGRLDPIASGVMILLVGDAVHQKDEYTKLEKTYICKAILGISTDTYDILGIPKKHEKNVSFDQLHETLLGFKGQFEQVYPPYSSKTIGGKQMHQLARLGELPEKLPSRMVTISDISDISLVQMSQNQLISQVIETIQKVQGDFRQLQIIESWQKLNTPASQSLGTPSKREGFQTVTFTITVSSGTYIRGVVDQLGKNLGTGACILELHRISVGPYKIKGKA